MSKHKKMALLLVIYALGVSCVYVLTRLMIQDVALSDIIMITSICMIGILLWLVMNSTFRQSERGYNGEALQKKVSDALEQFRYGQNNFRLHANSASEKPIVNAVNDIISTLEYMIEREQAFSANAAHELKTPLAELLSTIDLALLKPRSEGEYKNALKKLKGICASMHEMHDNILALARSDQGLITVESKQYSIRKTLDDCLASFEKDFQNKNIELQLKSDQDFQMNRGREKLRMVFNNLLSNMACYVNESGKAAIVVQRDVSGIGISFKNSGCALDPKDAQHVLDPYWRQGADAHREKRHLGVGLNISERILKALGASIKIHISKKGVFHANVFLPMDLIAE